MEAKTMLRDYINSKQENLLLKSSYSSSLTGEIPRPSYWWWFVDVFASFAGWLLIGMLTPVIPVRGMCECLECPLVYGVDMRRRGESPCREDKKHLKREVCTSYVTLWKMRSLLGSPNIQKRQELTYDNYGEIYNVYMRINSYELR